MGRFVIFVAVLLSAAALFDAIGAFSDEGAQTNAVLRLAVALALCGVLYGWHICRRRLAAAEAANEAERRRHAQQEEECVRLKQRCHDLQQEIERLAVRRELSAAAASHVVFEDFLEEAMRLAHDLAAAQDVNIFLASSAGLLPRASCRVERGMDLCLSFSAEGSRLLAAVMAGDGVFDCEALSIRRLSASRRGHQLLLTGDLEWREKAVGMARLTLCGADDDRLEADRENSLFCAEIAKVKIDRSRLAAALTDAVSCFDAGAQLLDLACPLAAAGETLGVLQARFACCSESETSALWEERLRFLRDSAMHMAQALMQEQRYLQATQDELTGLCNRRHLLAQLDRYFRLACRRGSPLALIMMDIDHFKSLNDRHGHLCGDRALRQVGEILRANVRGCDIAGRYGGEEMAVAVPDSVLAGAVGLAERLRRRIASTPLAGERGETIFFTASFGVAEYQPGMRRLEELVARADAALYQAKQAGRNRVMAWREAPAPKAPSHRHSKGE